MRAAVDTNVLVRLFAPTDDPEQQAIAMQLVSQADLLAVSAACICEIVWVLRAKYDFSAPDIAFVIQWILDLPHVAVCEDMVNAGLDLMEAGGDFADGIMAFEGRSIGGNTFVTFDQGAVKKLKSLGLSAHLLGGGGKGTLLQ